ncbi:MAG: LysR family transcriptional regulator, partial [Deltaproteobacteria bacterium]|nr:LysR family transcriptional regulator [Deltaproteobacteria bacterium]
MDINRIRYFSVVVETKHLRKAAELLHVSPGALSKSIKTLEYEIRKTLIQPSGRGILITDDGIEFYRKSKGLLSEYHFLFDTSPKRSSIIPTLKIGSFEIFTSYFLTKLIEKEFPEEKLRAQELIPGKIEEALELREVDIGITYIPYPRESVEHVEVGTFISKIFGPKNLKDVPFEKLPFAIPVTPVNSSASQFQSLDGWPNFVYRSVKYEFELLESAIQVSRNGFAVLYCPS